MKTINKTTKVTTVEQDLRIVTYRGLINTGDNIICFYGNDAKRILSLNDRYLDVDDAKALNILDLLKNMPIDEDNEYEGVNAGLVYTYHFNDGSSIEYNCVDYSYYYDDKDGLSLSESELYSSANINKDTLAWKYFDDSLINQHFSQYAEDNELEVPELDTEREFDNLQKLGDEKQLLLSLKSDHTVHIAINYGTIVLKDSISMDEAKTYVQNYQ